MRTRKPSRALQKSLLDSDLADTDSSGIRGLEANSVDVERLQVVIEVNMQPFASRGLRSVTSYVDEPNSDAPALVFSVSLVITMR